jgi:hypothetical protein
MQEDNNNIETFPLDDAAIGMIAELENQMRAAQVATQAIVTYFARQQGLTGDIRIADNRRELIIRPRTPHGVQQS